MSGQRSSPRFKRNTQLTSPKDTTNSKINPLKRKRGASITSIDWSPLKIDPFNKKPRGPSVGSPALKKGKLRYPSNRSQIHDINKYVTIEIPKRRPTVKAQRKPKPLAEENSDSPKSIHAIVLSNEKGNVLTMGQGSTGQLGLGDSVFERVFPTVVKDTDGNALQDVISVVAGGMHTLCLTSNGKVYSFGCNDEGALGRFTKDEDDCFVPGLVEQLEDHIVVQITAGDSHSMFLTDEGLVYGTGTFRDANGLIGLTKQKVVEKLPVQIMMPCHNRIRKIASGLDHIVCLTVGGQLITAGCADQGQLGRITRMQSTNGGRQGIQRLLRASVVYVTRRRALFSDIWTGQYNTYAKALNRPEIWTCGLNNYYQIGFDDIESRFNLLESDTFRTEDGTEILTVAGGQHHTLAMDTKRNIYAIGRPDYGRLGLGDSDDVIQVPTKITTLCNASCISADTAVSYAIVDGDLFAWGMGSNNQLGGKEDDDLLIPTIVPGKQMGQRRAVGVSAGGQHVVILAKEIEA